jgi:ABC-type multidrug transport system fused ATPase/permease subunit
MEQGRIVERGTYEELMGTSQRFRSLAAIAEG